MYAHRNQRHTVQEVTCAILYETATINQALLRLCVFFGGEGGIFMNRLSQRTARDRGQLQNITYQNSK